jgi:hypothetical protein
MPAELPEVELARSLAVGLRADFPEREATARQLAELLLDAIAAAIPLTRHEPADGPLAQLETLAQQSDVYGWEGAPGWDVVLQQGLGAREALAPGPAVLDGLGTKAERTHQRGELKRRAHAEAERLVALGREVARFGAGGTGAGAEALDQMPTLSAADALVAAHASLVRLVGYASAASLLLLPEDPRAGALPQATEEALLREMDERGDFAGAQEEWLAYLLAKNPAAAQAPAFRTFFAGLSQTLRSAVSLRRFREAALGGALLPDVEALLGALGTWQPARWSSLRAGAPSAWIVDLCPAAPAPEAPLRRLARECTAGLALMSRLWFAQDLSLTGFTALAALFVARCASVVALWEELGGGKAEH